MPESYNSLLGGEQATAETAGLQASAAQTLTELRDGLLSNGLFDGATALDIRDLSDIQFTYQNRIQVRLGSEMNLATSCGWRLRRWPTPKRAFLPAIRVCWTSPTSRATVISARISRPMTLHPRPRPYRPRHRLRKNRKKINKKGTACFQS
mgnify:FL=1